MLEQALRLYRIPRLSQTHKDFTSKHKWSFRKSVEHFELVVIIWTEKLWWFHANVSQLSKWKNDKWPWVTKGMKAFAAPKHLSWLVGNFKGLLKCSIWILKSNSELQHVFLKITFSISGGTLCIKMLFLFLVVVTKSELLRIQIMRSLLWSSWVVIMPAIAYTMSIIKYLVRMAMIVSVYLLW